MITTPTQYESLLTSHGRCSESQSYGLLHKTHKRKRFLISYPSTQKLKISFESCVQPCVVTARLSTVILTIQIDDYALHNIKAVFFCDSSFR
jgi:hypothetical protein